MNGSTITVLKGHPNNPPKANHAIPSTVFRFLDVGLSIKLAMPNMVVYIENVDGK